VNGLLSAGAQVTVVSPDLHPELRELWSHGQIEYRARGYLLGDIEGMTLVLVATNDGAVNGRIATDCRALGVWVNAADDPPNCDFILPSVIRKGKITLAASTAGASPALARRLREDLEQFLDEDLSALADLLGGVRTELRSRQIRVDPDRWQTAIDARLRALLAQKRFAEARTHLLAGLGVQSADPE
jgi:siroheme synthase-like protein